MFAFEKYGENRQGTLEIREIIRDRVGFSLLAKSISEL
jgi:hypothetical protein